MKQARFSNQCGGNRKTALLTVRQQERVSLPIAFQIKAVKHRSHTFHYLVLAAPPHPEPIGEFIGHGRTEELMFRVLKNVADMVTHEPRIHLIERTPTQRDPSTKAFYPAMARVVLLPAPLAPITARNSPPATWRSVGMYDAPAQINPNAIRTTTSANGLVHIAAGLRESVASAQDLRAGQVSRRQRK